MSTLLISITLALALISDPTGLKTGQKAPDFVGVDQNGTKIRLYETLKSEKVILTFYRGAWCRYCMGQFKDYQDSLSFIKDKGATIIAVSPEHEVGIAKSAKTSKADFSLVHDEGLKIMLDYKVISEEKVDEYKQKKQDTGEDNQHKFLPVPALYIVEQDGTISYVSFNPNYRVRESVKTFLEQL